MSTLSMIMQALGLQGLLGADVPMPPRRPEGLLSTEAPAPTEGLLYSNPPMPPKRQIDNTYKSLIEYGVDPIELQGIIAGESSGNPQAQNKKTKASGLFQFTPTVAKELGTSVDEILKMSPQDQSELYLKYLKRWNWKPGVPLGLMQAAPSLAKTWSKRNKEDVVYKKGSPAWKSNPGWRPKDGGDITVSSIENYYASKQ